MKNNLKTLCGVFTATLLLAGCSGPEKKEAVQKEPELIKETKTMILIKTTKGDIKLELDAAKAPKTVANFLKYVESSHYTDTIFHRVIGNFMIQGGGMTAKMAEKNAPYKVENEANNGLKNVRGSIAMARTSDPHSAGAQFFINVVDNGFLDFKSPTQQGWGYCVFGKVVEGMDVVDVIRNIPTASGDVPKETITITEVSVIE